MSRAWCSSECSSVPTPWSAATCSSAGAGAAPSATPRGICSSSWWRWAWGHRCRSSCPQSLRCRHAARQRSAPAAPLTRHPRLQVSASPRRLRAAPPERSPSTRPPPTRSRRSTTGSSMTPTRSVISPNSVTYGPPSAPTKFSASYNCPTLTDQIGAPGEQQVQLTQCAGGVAAGAAAPIIPMNPFVPQPTATPAPG